MPENSSSTDCCEGGGPAVRPGSSGVSGTLPSGPPRAPWVAPSLATLLIATTAVDVVGNLLVILSVLTSRKLRNAGERRSAAGSGPPLPSPALGPWP